MRQIFNDTGADALWLIVGTPAEAANTLEMTPEKLAELYPDGPKALPPSSPEVRRAQRGSPRGPARAGVPGEGAALRGELISCPVVTLELLYGAPDRERVEAVAGAWITASGSIP